MLFKNHSRHVARSAGTSQKARIKVNEQLIARADVIFVMETKHRDILKRYFPDVLREKLLVVLDIEDRYPYGDEELIAILKERLMDYL